MTIADPDFLDVDGDAIAVRHREGSGPGVMWLGGYRSDMLGTKAERLDQWAVANRRAFTRHDYSGHGESGGAFRDGTISRWANQSLAVMRAFTTGPQVLVGSSMGAWIALRMVEELARAGEADRVGALLLLAPAPDFTSELMEPQLSDAQRRELSEKGYLEEASEYSPEPNIYTRALFEDGARNKVMKGRIETGCPVQILQGMEDPDVPHAHAMRLLTHLPDRDVAITLIRDGDHRLSRPQDLSMILHALEGLVERIADAG